MLSQPPVLRKSSRCRIDTTELFSASDNETPGSANRPSGQVEGQSYLCGIPQHLITQRWGKMVFEGLEKTLDYLSYL